MNAINTETGEVMNTIPLSIYKSIKKVQEKVGKIKKDAKGHNYSYATLGAIVDAVYNDLHSDNIVVSQTPTKGQSCASIETILVNVDNGEYLSCITEVPIEQKKISDPQAFGSAITYGRRYALLSILGLVTEDDDGSKARINFDDEMKKIAFCDSLDDLKMMKPYFKDNGFPNWQVRCLEVVAEKKEESLSKANI